MDTSNIMLKLRGCRAHHVHALWVVREEVRNAPVLLDVVLRVGLERVHHVWELDAVSYEEHLPRPYAWSDLYRLVPASRCTVKP